MEANTTESGPMERSTAAAPSTTVQIVKNTKVTGSMIKSKVTAFNGMKIAANMKAIGWKETSTDMESTHIQMEANTAESGSLDASTDLATTRI